MASPCHTMTPPNNTVLVTRCCRRNMSSDFNPSFIWPTSGFVKAPDWERTATCGNGLHGWLYGIGDTNAWEPFEGDQHLVVEVNRNDLVELDRKVKFAQGNVVFCGTPSGMGAYMAERGHAGVNFAQLKDENSKILFVGAYGTAIVGNFGTAYAGYKGVACAGSYGHTTAGNGGTATVGSFGEANVGEYGHANVGVHSHANVGLRGTVKGDVGASFTIKTLHGVVVGYVGKNGILPNVTYQVSNGELVVADLPKKVQA